MGIMVKGSFMNAEKLWILLFSQRFLIFGTAELVIIRSTEPYMGK
jgi:hypothetical protein